MVEHLVDRETLSGLLAEHPKEQMPQFRRVDPLGALTMLVDLGQSLFKQTMGFNDELLEDGNNRA